MEPRAGRRQTKSPAAARGERLCYKDAACRSSNRSPTSAKDAAPTSSNGWPTRSARPRRPPARPFVRRVAQPLGLHARRRRRRGRRPRSSRSSTSPSRRSICASTAASIRASAPSTSCRSCRSKASTMADCVALAKDVGAAVAERFARAGLSLRGGLREPRAEEPRRHPARRVRGAGREDGVAGLGARLRPGGAARDRRRLA